MEGDSEESFVFNLIIRKFYDKILYEKDLMEFVGSDASKLTHNVAYCENCGSVDKIPHKINEMYHFIAQSRSNDIFVICDGEDLGCPINRRVEIERKLKKDVEKSKMRYIFFSPMIEALYWQCKKIIQRIIQLEFKNRFKKTINIRVLVKQKCKHPLGDLKDLFKKHGLKYREALFAEQFFPGVDYENCADIVLRRAIERIESTLV